MKLVRLIPFALALALAVSCQKPQSEEERRAEIEREVQQRLASERQAEEAQRLAQEAADLDAREKALAEKETKAAATPRPTVRTTAVESSTSASAARSPRSYDTFYRKLEPHGAWRESVDYGYVWQPRAAQQSHNWRPYTDGRWAYTDAGWTWVSDEPFGWATYHYGRWTRLRGVGWVWVPGDEWAPAWVSWRKSDSHIGWAPLPPGARFERRTGIKHWADNYYDIDAGEYVFIPNEEIGTEEIERVVVPPERSIRIVTQTTNVTNITYTNNIIVNEGPSYDELRSRSRRPLGRMRIERQYDVEEQEAPRAVVRGDVISLMAPIFAARATETPRTSAPALQRTAVERESISGVDAAELERARQKMKAEATPPPDPPSRQYEKPVVAASTPAPAATAIATPPEPRASAAASPATEMVSTPTPRAIATPAATAAPRATAIPAATATAAPSTTVTPRPSTPPPPSPTITPAPSATATAPPRLTTTPAATAPATTPTPQARTATSPLPTIAASPTPAAPPPRVPSPSPGSTSPDESETTLSGTAAKSQEETRTEMERRREQYRQHRLKRGLISPAPAEPHTDEGAAVPRAGAPQVPPNPPAAAGAAPATSPAGQPPPPTTQPAKPPLDAPAATPAAAAAAASPSPTATPRRNRDRRLEPGTADPVSPTPAPKGANEP